MTTKTDMTFKGEPGPELVSLKGGDHPYKTPEPETEAAAPEPELVPVTVNGVTLNAFADAVGDFELLDDIVMFDGGDRTRLTSILRRLMPDADRRAALDSVRNAQTGRVTMDAAFDLMTSLFDGLNSPN